MASQLTIRIDVEDGTEEAPRSSARNAALAVAAAAGSLVLSFPAAAQRLSAECKVCVEQCGTPILYPDDGTCPNPILYPDSLIAIGCALLLGLAGGVWFGRRGYSRNQPMK